MVICYSSPRTFIYHLLLPVKYMKLQRSQFTKNYLFLKRGKVREKERETNIDQLPPACAPTGDQAYNPGMYTDRELNWWPFTLWDDTQPTEPHRSGPKRVHFSTPNSVPHKNLPRGGANSSKHTQNTLEIFVFYGYENLSNVCLPCWGENNKATRTFSCLKYLYSILDIQQTTRTALTQQLELPQTPPWGTHFEMCQNSEHANMKL